MKSVLISIQPRWCEKIANGEKIIEVRKNSPKLETPFKCYIYQTNTGWGYPILRSLGKFVLLDILDAGKGKVIGEFICNRIEEIGVENSDLISVFSCLSKQDMWKYAEPKSMYDLKAWHISKLKIYGQAKELSEFRKPCVNDLYCEVCAMYSEFKGKCYNAALQIIRPPQSWCYVEEVNT